MIEQVSIIHQKIAEGDLLSENA